MAVIPNVAELPRRIPTGNQPVATVRNAGAIGDAVADFGSSGVRAAQHIKDYQDRRTARETSSATTGFALDLFEHGNSYDQSEDWSGMVEDFNGNAANLLSEYADGIGDPRARARFVELGNLRIAEQREKVKDKAFIVETDVKRAETLEHLDRLREMVILGEGEEAIALAEAQLVSDAQMNYITEQERVKLLETFKQDSVKAWIQTQPPKKRVDLLNSSIAKDNLPSDYRAITLREAEADTLSSKAQDLADGWDEEGLTDEQVVDRLRNVEDVKLRDEAAGRSTYGRDLQRTARNQRDIDLFEGLNDQLNDGMLYGELDRTLVASLPAEMEANLKVIASQIAKAQIPAVSDINAISRLQKAQDEGRWGDVVSLYSQHSGSLSTEDRKTWSKATVDAGLPDAEHDTCNDSTYETERKHLQT